MHLVNQSRISVAGIAELEAAIPEQDNLKDLMVWALANPSEFASQVVTGVVVQDEFTHDVIVPWRDGLVLVYDTT